MKDSILADAVYYIVLYSALAMLAVPLVFLLFWKFLQYFKKHRRFFYILAVILFAGVIAVFYMSRNVWLLSYHAFPTYIQEFGLLLFVCSLLIMRLADHHLGMKVRLFWPVLKGDRFELATGGLYKIVRHPIYALIPVLILGALLYSGEWILLLPLLFNILTRRWYAGKEEAYVAEFASGDYASYKKQTPHRFYPKIF